MLLRFWPTTVVAGGPTFVEIARKGAAAADAGTEAATEAASAGVAAEVAGVGAAAAACAELAANEQFMKETR